MCGIIAVINSSEDPISLRSKVLAKSKKLRHRGPDWSGIVQTDKAVLAHERLGIVDPYSGTQPFYQEGIILTVNGEIYNHRELRKLVSGYEFQTQSDCEVIIPLYKKYRNNLVNMLDGIFAFVLYDTINDTYLIARDHVGVMPLYMGFENTNKNIIWFASEFKAIDETNFDIFPPGHYYSDKMYCYYNPLWNSNNNLDLNVLREALENAVNKQIMTDVPYGVLISGGLDSSLIASILAKNSEKINSFSIGLIDSPDLKFANKVAEYLGTNHYSFNFTVQEGLDAISDVIYHLETYDVTTIRASTPMYFLARKIKAMGIKMVFSGEGADEIFGGYLYFHNAPSTDEFHEETVRRIKNLHLFDCLRANKSTAAWGLEVRVPFLDKEFLNVAMNINPYFKTFNYSGPEEKPIEKYILRKSFDDGYLPDSILWRQKEQFSDGVGYGWIDGIKNHTEKIISDEQLSHASDLFPYNTPTTKEAYWFRSIFESHFPSISAIKSVQSWIPTWSNSTDPSGRVQQNHESYKN